MIHKEKKQTNFAIKPEPSTVKPNLPGIVELCEFKINGKSGTLQQNLQTEFYGFDLPNSKWAEENIFRKGNL